MSEEKELLLVLSLLTPFPECQTPDLNLLLYSACKSPSAIPLEIVENIGGAAGVGEQN